MYIFSSHGDHNNLQKDIVSVDLNLVATRQGFSGFRLFPHLYRHVILDSVERSELFVFGVVVGRGHYCHYKHCTEYSYSFNPSFCRVAVESHLQKTQQMSGAIRMGNLVSKAPATDSAG